MDVSTVSPETQKYITEILDRRSRNGIFESDACQEVLQYAQKADSDAVRGIGCYLIAENNWRDRKVDETMRYLTESAKCFLKEGMGEFLTRTYNMMGSVSDSQNNRVAALNYFYIGLQYAEKYGLTYERGMVDFNIGFVLFRMKRYEDAVGHYESAVHYYGLSGDSYYRSYNFVLAKQHLGSCYLKLGRRREALLLLEQIRQMQREWPDRNYPEVNLLSFRAECAAAAEDREKFLAYTDALIDTIRPQQGIGEEADNLESIVELLYRYRELERMDRLFQTLEDKGLSESPMLYMSLYPYRSKCLLEQGRMDECIRLTQAYFEVYEQDRQNHKLAAAKIMELQDELRNVEKEQDRIAADNRRLEAIAQYDPMTGLGNRIRINDQLSRKFEESLKNGTVLGVELLDIDCFKSFNDTYGHLAGDQCIVAVAGVLKEMENAHIFCGRYGGDEFVVIYSGLTEQEIRQAAERIRREVCGLGIAHKKSSEDDVVTVSQGICAKVPDPDSREWEYSVLADEQLYRAKHDGKNCFRMASGAARS